jgi:hypothetical protein
MRKLKIGMLLIGYKKVYVVGLSSLLLKEKG